MKIFMGYAFVLILGIVVITHVLKIVGILFKIKSFEKYQSLSAKPNNFSLILYYVLAIAVCVSVIMSRLETL